MRTDLHAQISLDMMSMCVSAKELAKFVIMGGHLESLYKRRNWKKRFQLSRSVTLCLGLSVLGGVLASPVQARPETVSGAAYVIDGDTLVIRKRHIRLFGIDAFERDQTCGRYRCGIAARKALHDLVDGQMVRCEKRDIDPYERMVAVCKLPSGADLGGEMVRRGLAVAYRHFSTQYIDEEAYARSHKRGAWAYGFESPLQYRREHPHS
ncbi:MAG: thermonuclease family protein [Asticcacaulis sp.]|uniref:thermonuclease family protein n=1 Tax=Asticcacaulis sp. TaxID=1872648 RepID=UPI0039E4E7D9